MSKELHLKDGCRIHVSPGNVSAVHETPNNSGCVVLVVASAYHVSESYDEVVAWYYGIPLSEPPKEAETPPVEASTESQETGETDGA